MNELSLDQNEEGKKKDILADADIRQRAENFGRFLSQNWLRFVALIATGTLTWIAGWTLTHNLFYTSLLVLLAEGASLFWTARTEDNGNPTQEKLSVWGMAISWIAIIVTDLSSATILANMANQALIATAKAAGEDPSSVQLVFTLFDHVPALAQQIVTYVIPFLAVTHGILGTSHYYYSEDAKLKRETDKTDRDARKLIAKAKADARTNIAQAKANRFKQIAEQSAEGIGIAEGEKLWQTTYRNSGMSDNVVLASETESTSNVRQTKKTKAGSNGHNKEQFEDENP
jgi:hypothetical protein